MLKRSVVNETVSIGKRVFAEMGLRLPPFAFMTVDDWKHAGHEYDEIRDCCLGWDVTDFGMNNFAVYGRCLFTLRNGKKNAAYPKSYAEKFILDPEGQRAPAHFHRNKREDIINRGTGEIVIDLASSAPDGSMDTKPLEISIDGVRRTIQSQTKVILKPGESIHLEPGVIHSFWGEKGILINGVYYGASGEVSSVCDDFNDNFFLNGAPRFPGIEEDVERDCFLCQEYPKAF
ncbi:MAG: D-lyxose/D-mannose family sugar isomerase [Victivallales bacterium]|nr:D-lyxose/D-mannose family sugar isomerase [Victivallales bacterium]